MSNACLGAAQVEQINISRDQEKLLMLVDSNWPIQYEFDTKKKGRAIAWTLKGADYYQALTDYFTAFDIDSLLDCLDNLVIIPIDKQSARFEADLGSGLSASIHESKAPSGSYRLIMQVIATRKDAACFAHPVPPALVAAEGLFAPPPAPPAAKPAAPEIKPQARPIVPTPPAVISQSALPSTDHELTAEEIVKAQQRQRKQHLEAQKVERRITGRASDEELQEHFQNELAGSSYTIEGEALLDHLNYSNKGGLKGVNWLQKYGDSEIREINASISNQRARFPYHVSLQSYTQYIENGDRIDERKLVVNRAWLGYRLSRTIDVRAGIMYEPSGGDASSDLGALPFMEKGLSSYLSPLYNPGVLFSFHDTNVSFDVGGFGQRSDEADTSQSTSMSVAYSFRAGVDVLARFDAAYSQAKAVDNKMAIEAAPEAHLILPTMYVGAQTDIDSIKRNSLGVIWLFHGLSYAANVAQVKLDTPNSGITEYSSKNIWFTYMTGSKRRRLQGGKWLAVHSEKSLGEINWSAWELGYRYSALQDNTEEHLITKTFVLNWYVNKYITVKNNYIFATQVSSPNDPSRPIDNDADLFLTRIQFNWY